ncbi:MAG: dTDP-4-dehydrorhamnose reductase [Candidatus Gastranaerophilales bacterium]|nr:dTDP-4-dehydrorhamnose reductase [Candidatus Gastranaerophilales bacterium]
MDKIKKVLVTGAKGMLGQDLCPTLEDAGFEVIETDVHNLDITNELQTFDVIKTAKPDYIIHCAAYTNVNKAEEDEEKAFLLNAKGAENVAKAAEKISATMIYISTDYVFDGEKASAYEPDDKTNPINAYGRTKLAGEIAVEKNCSKYYIARTSWLYGIHGKNFVETMITLAEKNLPEIKVVDDQIGRPTWAVDLANALVELIEDDIEEPEYGVYHLTGGGKPVSWYGFTKEIFKLMNFDVNLIPCKSDEFPSPAIRPKSSFLDNEDRCPDWKKSLKEYIELR